MSEDNHTDQLRQLRSRVVTNLADMSTDLAATDAIDLNTLMVIAHSTGRVDLLQAAYTRIQSIPEVSARAEAYLDLLDEVDYLLQTHEDNGDEAVAEPAPDIPEHPAQPAPEQHEQHAPADDLLPDETELTDEQRQ